MKIRDYYDRTAEERPENYQESSWWMNALVHRPNDRFTRRVVRAVLRDAESVADLGCGNGEYHCCDLPRLRRLFLNDLSPKMLRSTSTRLREAHPGVEVSTHLGSIDTIPTDVPPCDVAICLGVLNHFEPDALDRALATVARMARQRIVLYYAHEAFLMAARVGVTFRDMDIHYGIIERGRVADLLDGLGFTLVRSSYTFRSAALSPMVIQEFRVKASTGS